MESFTIKILLAGALFLILGVQLYTLLNKPGLKRKTLKIVLNVLFWISLILLVFPPSFTKNNNAKKILITNEDIPNSHKNKLADSLNIGIVKNSSEVKEELSENADYIKSFNEVFFLGNTFKNDFLSNFSGLKTTHIPYFNTNEPSSLRYRGIIKETENQVIRGSIVVDKKSTLKLVFGTETIDSLVLNKGSKNFEFDVSTFSLGKTRLELRLDDKLSSNINYFVEPSRTLSILIMLPYPSFEGNSLANLLASKGHKVRIQTAIAKNTNQKIDINKTEIPKNIDLVICTTTEIGSSVVSNTLKNDGRLLIFGIENVLGSLNSINKRFGTRFKAKKTSNEEEVTLENNVGALPYSFEKTSSTLINKRLPIAYDRKGLAVSLLTETFPNKLAGDSITYTKTWNTVLNALNINQENNIEVNAPLGTNTNTRITFNNFKALNKILVSDDTLGVYASTINNKTAFGNFTFRKTGWQKLGDSQVFVEDSTNAIASSNRIKQYLSQNAVNLTNESLNSSGEKLLKPWMLWALCMLLYIILWVEPKL